MALLINYLLKFKHRININFTGKHATQSFTTALKQSSNFVDILPAYINLNNEWSIDSKEKATNLIKDMTIQENFLTESEESNILKEIEPYMKRLRYEFDHWDNAIHGFRETERLHWNEQNKNIINRLRELAFPKNVAQLKHVHILDLADKGYIKPHIDATRFCGNTIAGMSLLSDCIMRLVDDKNKKMIADVLLKRRSVYIMKDTARYDYTHEILADAASYFKSEKIPRNRRISIICRNEPK